MTRDGESRSVVRCLSGGRTSKTRPDTVPECSGADIQKAEYVDILCDSDAKCRSKSRRAWTPCVRPDVATFPVYTRAAGRCNPLRHPLDQTYTSSFRLAPRRRISLPTGSGIIALDGLSLRGQLSRSIKHSSLIESLMLFFTALHKNL